MVRAPLLWPDPPDRRQAVKKIRCAIYTRKSTEEGLEQEFNSLDAQRDACAAYVASQKHEGWVLLPAQYDDGGISGGTMERPGLKELLQHVEEGFVDQIIVYKIDRLTRSLTDFAKIVDRLDASDASFVSVTQSFNTATSMGRLTLNMLMSFAQFEREVTAERIRDKIAASKRRGLWMGGKVPIGYEPDGRTLTIHDGEAKTVRTIYDLYEKLGTARAVKVEADRLNLLSRVRQTSKGKVSGGGTFDRSHIHHILTNPIYAGRVRHKTLIHDGQHEAIIDPARWDHVQTMLQQNTAKDREKKTSKNSSLLCGKLFDETGDRLTPSHTKTKRGTRIRYYISHRLIKCSGEANLDGWRLPAEELETKIAHLVRQRLSSLAFQNALLQDAASDEIGRCHARLQTQVKDGQIASVLALIDRVEILPGKLVIHLDNETVAELFDLDRELIPEALIKFEALFQLRKRGVETRLILEGTPTTRDMKLIANIAKAHQWFEEVKAGKTFRQIAETHGTSTRRVQQVIDLAFLAPDIVRDILEGSQPLGLKSDWCNRHALPPGWAEQRAVIATL